MQEAVLNSEGNEDGPDSPRPVSLMFRVEKKGKALKPGRFRIDH